MVNTEVKHKKQQIESNRQLLQSHLWAYLLLGVFLVAVLFTRNLSGDVWWHLMTGRWILEHKAFPSADPFSYTANHPVVLYEWLSDVSSWIIYSKISPSALAAVCIGLVALSFLIIFRLATSRSASIFASVIILGLGAMASSTLSEMRPQMFSYLFFAITLVILHRYSARGDRSIWLLAPLSVIWTNFHGVVLVGVATILLEAIVCLVCPPDWAAKERRPRLSAALTPLILVAACSLLVLIKPNSLEVYQYPLIIANHTGTSGIPEWGSPSFHETTGKCIMAIVSIMLISLAMMDSRPRFRDCTYVGAFLVLALISTRHIPFFALASAAPLSVWLTSALKELESKFAVSKWKLIQNLAWGMVIAITASFALWRANDINQMNAFDYMSMSETLPQAACDFVMANDLQGPMLNDINFGGYLIYRLWPTHKVFVDARQGPYIGGAWEDSVDTIYNIKEHTWQKVLDKYRVRFAIIPVGSPLVSLLAEQPNWAVAFTDDTAVVFVRNCGERN